MKTKGLSDLVNTVLIILLILVALAIIWFFLRPFIFNTSENLEEAGSCYQTTVEPTRCLYTAGNDEQKHIFLTIKREGQNINLSGLDLIFTTTTGEYRTFRENQLLANITPPSQFETRRPIVRIDKLLMGDFTPRSVKIAVILGRKGNVCPPFSQEISCQEYQFSGRNSDVNEDTFFDGQDYDWFFIQWGLCCQGPGESPECLTPRNRANGEVCDYSSIPFSVADFNGDFIIDQQDYLDFNSVYEKGL